MSRVVVLVLLIGAMCALTASSATSLPGASKRAGTIAFIRLEDGPVFGGGLFVIHPDGSGLRRVTPAATRVYSYAWSPDGTLLAYIDDRLSLWLIHPDGSGVKLLLPTTRLSSWNLSWSPDGKNIAILSTGPNANPRSVEPKKVALYVVPIDGSQPELLPGGQHIGWNVAWSPRGNEIAYDNGGIWLIHPDGTGRHPVSTRGSGPQWSRDGAQVAFNLALRRGGHVVGRYRAFGVVNADGKDFHIVTTHAYTEYGEVWSPTGHRILYGAAGGQGIYVIGSSGLSNRRVTRDSPPGADWGALAWSPNGSSIVYTTGGTRNPDLYVIGVNGRNKVRLTNTPDTDLNPSWVAR